MPDEPSGTVTATATLEHADNEIDPLLSRVLSLVEESMRAANRSNARLLWAIIVILVLNTMLVGATSGANLAIEAAGMKASTSRAEKIEAQTDANREAIGKAPAPATPDEGDGADGQLPTDPEPGDGNAAGDTTSGP